MVAKKNKFDDKLARLRALADVPEGHAVHELRLFLAEKDAFFLGEAAKMAKTLELHGLASHITINFPWGSLLESLLNGDDRLLHGLQSVARSPAALDIRLNGGALAEQGWALEEGTERIFENLTSTGWKIRPPEMLDSHALRAFPSTWAKRLAFGRDPRAMQLSGCL